MDCELIGNLLPNYLDGDLTEELSEKVQAHLIRCNRCAWEVESIQQSVSALHHSAKTAHPAAEFRARLLAELLRDHRAALARRPAGPSARRSAAREPVYVLDSNGEEAANG
jgi:anti-sigma factor RsiW